MSENRVPSCECGLPCLVRTSWSDRNPGRRYVRCRYYLSSVRRYCRYFDWIDPPTIKPTSPARNASIFRDDGDLLVSDSRGGDSDRLKNENGDEFPEQDQRRNSCCFLCFCAGGIFLVGLVIGMSMGN